MNLVDPVEELVAERRSVLSRPPTPRETIAYTLGGVVFLALAIPLALTGWSGVAWDWLPAIALTLSYAAATRVRFETGIGSTDGSLLAFVPMLFVLPAELVPLLVAAGLFIGRLPDLLRRELHPLKAQAPLTNSLHALAPAAVLALAADAAGPYWGDWPWYLLAFVSYALSDAVTAIVTEWVAHKITPSLQLRVLAEVYALDALLAPLGLMAAFATRDAPYAFLLAAPLLVLLRGEARERAARLDKALELSESRRELLEAELAAARSREETLATVSHGLQLPLASLMGLTGLLRERGEDLTAGRRQEIADALHGEARGLRQLVRQALDFVALRSGRDLLIAPGDTDLAPIAEEAGVSVEPGPRVHVDAARLRQVLIALRDYSARCGGSDLSLVAHDGTLVAHVSLPGPRPDGLFAAPEGPLGTDEAAGPGIDLYVAHELCALMGGELATSAQDAGWTLTARLPARQNRRPGE